MKIAGINQDQIVFIQLIRGKIDGRPVAVATADQQFHIRMPVNGVEILIINPAGDVDLGAAVKNKVFIIPVDP